MLKLADRNCPKPPISNQYYLPQTFTTKNTAVFLQRGSKGLSKKYVAFVWEFFTNLYPRHTWVTPPVPRDVTLLFKKMSKSCLEWLDKGVTGFNGSILLKKVSI